MNKVRWINLVVGWQLLVDKLAVASAWAHSPKDWIYKGNASSSFRSIQLCNCASFTGRPYLKENLMIVFDWSEYWQRIHWAHSFALTYDSWKYLLVLIRVKFQLKFWFDVVVSNEEGSGRMVGHPCVLAIMRTEATSSGFLMSMAAHSLFVLLVRDVRIKYWMYDWGRGCCNCWSIKWCGCWCMWVSPTSKFRTSFFNSRCLICPSATAIPSGGVVWKRSLSTGRRRKVDMDTSAAGATTSSLQPLWHENPANKKTKDNSILLIKIKTKQRWKKFQSRLNFSFRRSSKLHMVPFRQ